MNSIKIVGARQNNLKNISLEIPKNKITVFTGVSGSDKSSLVFETIDGRKTGAAENGFANATNGSVILSSSKYRAVLKVISQHTTLRQAQGDC